MAVKFPPPGLIVLLLAVLLVVSAGLGRPFIVPLEALLVVLADIVELTPLAVAVVLLTDVVLLVVPAAAAAPVPLLSVSEHILCIDDAIVLLPPAATALAFAMFVALLPATSNRLRRRR